MIFVRFPLPREGEYRWRCQLQILPKSLPTTEQQGHLPPAGVETEPGPLAAAAADQQHPRGEFSVDSEALSAPGKLWSRCLDS